MWLTSFVSGSRSAFCIRGISVLQKCGMWSKIYLAILGLSLITMGFFLYYSWSWMQSIGLPAAAAAGYEYHASFAWPLLWITTIALLLLGNVILWTSRRAWALWATFIYFAAMALLRFFWLEQTYFQFRKINNLADGSFALGPFVAIIMVVVMAVIVFLDQFMVVRLHEKMYPQVTADPEMLPETADQA